MEEVTPPFHRVVENKEDSHKSTMRETWSLSLSHREREEERREWEKKKEKRFFFEEEKPGDVCK